MIQVLGDVTIEDVPTFLGVFATRGAELRREHGSRRSQVFAVAGETNRVLVLFEWESREAFERFLTDPAVKATMQSSGTVGRPAFTFLHRVGEFPG
jgi:heme-degrading monooxygenase HmoA